MLAISHCDLICILLMVKDIEHFFMCLFAICISSLLKRLFLLSIFYLDCMVYFLLGFESSFQKIYSRYQSFVRCVFWTYFLLNLFLKAFIGLLVTLLQTLFF